MQNVFKMDGYTLHIIPSKKFKDITIHINFKAPLTKESAALRAVLAFVMTSATKKYPTNALLSSYLDDLYGASLGANVSTKGQSHIISLRTTAVNQEFLPVNDDLLEKQIGEFKNFKEMKQYYEAQIEAASTTKQKAKLADKYNNILTEAIAPYVNKYGAAILSDGYYNNQNLANSIAEYVILPADQYYYGKTPRASYLRDLFHVGYRDNSALPSDKEVYEKYTKALTKVHEGASATAAAMLDRLIRDYKDGRIYISDYDYSRIIRMKAQLNARSKQ